MSTKAMTETQQRNAQRLYSMIFAKLYPAYVAKAEGKRRSKQEVDQIICWLTGHNAQSLSAALSSAATVEAFFSGAPAMNPARSLITGSVCGVKLHEIGDPLMLEIRYLDKLIDELAKGWPMDKILRSNTV